MKTYAVRLLKTGKHKIDVIRVIRDATGVSLPAAREMLEPHLGSSVLIDGVAKLVADALVMQLDAVGAVSEAFETARATIEPEADKAAAENALASKHEAATHHASGWQCYICGGHTDLAQCPIDGHVR